jgi:hypothetical protein
MTLMMVSVIYFMDGNSMHNWLSFFGKEVLMAVVLY